jgi:uncharacterized membrane protein
MLGSHLTNLWDRFRSSFWGLPGLAVCSAILAAACGTWIDVQLKDSSMPWSWMATTQSTARNTLSVIAGSMVTIVGVVFSITMVTFSIASSQYGSRVLRNRMQDYVTQGTFATLLGTAVYSLAALTLTRDFTEKGYEPNITLFISGMLVVISLMVLIYFIHHVATVIQASELVASLATDLRESIDGLFPEKIGEGSPSEDFHDSQEYESKPSWTISLGREGYIQNVDSNQMLQIAKDHDILLRLRLRPGDFVSSTEALAMCIPPPPSEDQDSLTAAVQNAVIVGNRRTPRQDLFCSMHELSQVAVRALSPGINDPYTAFNCIDRLAAALSILAKRKIPSGLRRDEDEVLRVITSPVTFEEAVAVSFDLIQEYARNSSSVTMRLFNAYSRIASACERSEDRASIKKHADYALQNFLSGEQPQFLVDEVRIGFDELVEQIENIEAGNTASGDADPSPESPQSKSKSSENSIESGDVQG